jgi:ProP effector
MIRNMRTKEIIMRKQQLHPRTAVINKSQKNLSKKNRLEALTWLSTTFPQSFDTTVSIAPLKLGIMDDILLHADKAMEAGISKSKLREAVVIFTRRIDYLTCLKAREMRVDLLGNPVAQVTEEEAERASLKIKKRIEKNAKNARKNNPVKFGNNANMTPTKAVPSSYVVAKASRQANFDEESMPIYPPQTNYGGQVNSQTPRSEPLVVKRKTIRAFDPDAVARLKEKLGLSRQGQE